MTKFKRTLVILLLLALALLSLSMYIRTKRLERQLLKEQESVAQAALELEGFKHAQVAKDLATVIPTLTPAVKKIAKAGATPALATHTVYEKVLVPVACPSVVEADTQSPQLSLGAEHEFVLALTPKGEPWHTSRLFVDYGLGGVTGRVELPASTTHTTVTLSKDVQDAFEMWSNRPPRIALVRPPKQWRMGLALGPGVTYTPSGDIKAGLTFLYGVQF